MDLPGVFYHSGTDGGGSSDAPPPGTFFNDQDQEMYRGNEQGYYLIRKGKDLFKMKSTSYVTQCVHCETGKPSKQRKIGMAHSKRTFLNKIFRKYKQVVI